ncbi:MAG: hypothetical protein ACT6S0_21335 [Roseateles sp.]|uniref:hypothetical protein n=1 Tax=Roseateles sp. TaxID=1971397 RepID=UPI004037071B
MATPESISKLIQTSGNSFHAKVARWLQANGWHTQISPYYMDQTQDKARELDLVAEKLWPIQDHFGNRFGDVVIRLFVECKFVAAEAVFWFTQKDVPAVQRLVYSTPPFRENNLYTQKHHYLSTSPKVAKLFSSANGKGTENEPFYKALNQALNGTVAMRDQPPNHPDLPTWGGRHRIVTLNYPLVVCSSFDQLFGVDFLADSDPWPISDNFQLEVQYAYFDNAAKARNELFLLDFVDFGKLDQFEADIDKEAKAAAYLATVS